MIATVTCNPSLDYHMWISGKLESGMLHRAKETSLRLGGKGINVSRVLANLHLPTVAYGFVAGRIGRMCVDLSEEEGLPFTPVWVENGMTRINVKLHGPDETEVNGTGPLISGKEVSALMQNLSSLHEGDTLVLSGSLAPGLDASWYGEVMDELKGRGVRFVLDTTRQSLLDALDRHPFLVKPNAQELGELFQMRIGSAQEAAFYGKRLVEMGASHVLVSMGGDGAVLVGGEDTYWSCPAPKGEVVDTIGSGDSMVAGFLYGYGRNGDLAEALRWAVACGSASAFSDHLAKMDEASSLYGHLMATAHTFSSR